MEDRRLCIYCNIQRPWIWHGQKLKDGSKIYVDTTGARWAGRRCPDCEKARVAMAIKHDDYERRHIAQHLEQRGLTVKSHRLPMAAELHGQPVSVGVVRAHIENGEILLEPTVADDVDLFAVVIQSIKICTREQLSHFKRAAMATNVRSCPVPPPRAQENPS